MVCGRCGQPLGGQVIPLRRKRRVRWLPAARPRQLWWLALMALVGVSGWLAALQIGDEKQHALPRERPRSGLGGRVL